MAKVLNFPPESTVLGNMKDGDLAEIITWHNREVTPGEIIQRCGNTAFIINQPEGESYPKMFAGPSNALSSNKIRILKSGTTIIL